MRRPDRADTRYPPLVDLDFLPPEATGLGAPLGLMSAPGSQRPLREDLAELAGTHRLKLLVSLLCDEELAPRGIPHLVETARAAQLDILRFPIEDFSTPEAPEDLFPVVRQMLATTRSGGAVTVHCWAGLGRSGLVAASCLAADGHSADDAIALVRRYRRFAVQTRAQERFVVDFATRWYAQRD